MSGIFYNSSMITYYNLYSISSITGKNYYMNYYAYKFYYYSFSDNLSLLFRIYVYFKFLSKCDIFDYIFKI